MKTEKKMDILAVKFLLQMLRKQGYLKAHQQQKTIVGKYL